MNVLEVKDGARIYQHPNDREIKDPPREIQKRLADSGGLNIHGDPNFRLVWGWRRMELIWSPRAGQYDRRPKYFAKRSRWILEAWRAPFMTREEWAKASRDWIGGQSVELLGEYPSRGDYEIVMPIEGPHDALCQEPKRASDGDGSCVCGGQRFQPLTQTICDALVDMVKASREVTAFERREYFLGNEEKKQRDFDRLADDMIDDAGSAFGGNMNWVPMRGKSPTFQPNKKMFKEVF